MLTRKLKMGVMVVGTMAGLGLGFQGCGRFAAQRLTGSSQLSSTGGGSNSDKVRRLSNVEINNALNEILGDSTSPSSQFLPADPITPYDNDLTSHLVSTPLIEGIETLAIDVVTRFLADTSRRDRILGCRGLSTSDRNCMSAIVSKFSLLFFRHPQSAEDIVSWTDLSLSQAATGGDFYAGVDFFLRLALIHPKFIYRIEVPEPNDAVDFVVAERMAFLIWGTTPDSRLLTAAQNGLLRTKAQAQNFAATMLNDPRAIRRAKQFHAQWLAYEKLGHPVALANSLKSEADSIVERVLFTEKRPWADIFSVTESLMDNNVAEVYGLAPTGSATVRSLPTNRKGLLSTGAYLSAGAKFGDTSPTQRGKFVRNRLLCQDIPPPPPTTNVDEPPKPPASGPNCKKARYQAHSRPGSSCFGCHSQMDPVGFGLEQYDVSGKFRSFDHNPDGSDNTDCPIDGAGSLVGVGDFKGPAPLTDLLVNGGRLQTCMVIQYYHFAYGLQASGSDFAFVEAIGKRIASGAQFRDVVLEFVGSDRFLEN